MPRAFAAGPGGKRFARKFKRTIHVVDSTTIQLIASCLDWAKHRRRKAAAKCHLRLDLQSFLPRFAIIDTARENDAKRARELCAGIKDGEIVIFDKAYVDFAHLYDLLQRGVFWVTRAKDNLQVRGGRHYRPGPGGADLCAMNWSRLSNAGVPRRPIRSCCAGWRRWWRSDGKEVEMDFPYQ